MAYNITECDAGDYFQAYTSAYTKTNSEAYARTYAKTYMDTIVRMKAKAHRDLLTIAYNDAFTIAYKKALVKAKARAEAKTDINSQARAEAEAEAEAEANKEATIVAEAEVKVRAKLEPKPIVVAEAEAIAEEEAKAIFLHHLATDCLRLSTYFFHPIQQCAQQVYHTAVPLSPTLTLPYKSCLQYVVDNQLSHVTTFLGAPNTWGSLLRAIDIRPNQLTCIATSAQSIIAACEDIINIYDAVTFVLQQSLHTPETVIKIQCSLDRSILFFVHSFSVAIWDVCQGHSAP